MEEQEEVMAFVGRPSSITNDYELCFTDPEGKRQIMHCKRNTLSVYDCQSRSYVSLGCNSVASIISFLESQSDISKFDLEFLLSKVAKMISLV